MSAAVLRIGVEGGPDVRRALGTIVAEARRANATISADARRESTGRRRVEQEEVRDARRVWQQRLRERARIEREQTRAARAEARERARVEREASRSSAAAERERTRTARTEARERAREAEQAARREERAQRALTRSFEREYQQRLRWHRSVQQQIDRDSATHDRGQRGARAGGGYSSVWGSIRPDRMARAFASDIHGQVQGARENRASAEHQVNAALFGAGGNAGESSDLRRRLAQFVESPEGAGLQMRDLAQALNQAQTEFSVLGNRGQGSATTRRQGLEEFLQNATLARNTYQDVGEVSRVAGMLRGTGLDANAQRATLLSLTGIAQAGAVELSSVTRTAMAPIQARVQQRIAGLGGGATPEQRAQAAQQAVTQAMAEIEVARSAGYTPRAAGNIMATMGTALQSNVTQQRMLQNIRASRDPSMRALEGRLFDRGQLRTGLTDPLSLIQRLGEAGLDPVAAQNLFGGGGRGNPQSLQANWRRLLGAMLGQDTEGVAGWQRVQRLREGGTALTEADVQRGAQMVTGEDMTRLNQAEETRINQLRDEDSWIRRASDSWQQFMARNPFMATAGSSIGEGILGGAFTWRMLGRGAVGTGGAGVGGGTGALGAGSAAAGLGAGTIAAGLGGAALAAGSLYAMNEDVNARTGTSLGQRSMAALMGGAAERQLGEEIATRQAAYQRRGDQAAEAGRFGGASRVSAALGGTSRSLDVGANGLTAEQIAQAVRAGLMSLPPGAIRAEVDPHTAAHAASEGQSFQGQRRSPWMF